MNTKHFQSNGGYGKKIDRDHLIQVVVKKGLPCLAGWTGKPAQNAEDGALGNGDAQLFYFAMNARRTPQGIGSDHPFDQFSDLQGRRRSASLPAMRVARAGPEPAKPFALPPHDRVRLDVDQRTAPTGPAAAKSDPKHSIEGGENRPLAFSLEGCDLESKGGILRGDALVSPHEESEETEENQEEGWHPVSILPLHSAQNQTVTNGCKKVERHQLGLLCVSNRGGRSAPHSRQLLGPCTAQNGGNGKTAGDRPPTRREPPSPLSQNHHRQKCSDLFRNGATHFRVPHFVRNGAQLAS